MKKRFTVKSGFILVFVMMLSFSMRALACELPPIDMMLKSHSTSVLPCFPDIPTPIVKHIETVDSGLIRPMREKKYIGYAFYFDKKFSPCGRVVQEDRYTFRDLDEKKKVIPFLLETPSNLQESCLNIQKYWNGMVTRNIIPFALVDETGTLNTKILYHGYPERLGTAVAKFQRMQLVAEIETCPGKKIFLYAQDCSSDPLLERGEFFMTTKESRVVYRIPIGKTIMPAALEKVSRSSSCPM